MPTKNLGEKAARVLQFTMGLRNKGVAATLSAHGFTDEELADGWQKLSALTTGRLGTAVPSTLDPDALIALDTWENKWFPIAQASLAARFPEIHDVVFLNLAQTEGPAVIISVGTFIACLATQRETTAGKAALKLLAKRGITEAVIEQAKALVTKLSTVDTNHRTGRRRTGARPRERTLLWEPRSRGARLRRGCSDEEGLEGRSLHITSVNDDAIETTRDSASKDVRAKVGLPCFDECEAAPHPGRRHARRRVTRAPGSGRRRESARH